MNEISQHVLVIDDEPDIRELLDLTLSRMGLEVTTAEDLGEARRALQTATYRRKVGGRSSQGGQGGPLYRIRGIVGQEKKWGQEPR